MLPYYCCSYNFRETNCLQVRNESEWYHRSRARNIEACLFRKWWKTYSIHQHRKLGKQICQLASVFRFLRLFLNASDLTSSLQLKVNKSIQQAFSYYPGDDGDHGTADKQVKQRYIEVFGCCCCCYFPNLDIHLNFWRPRELISSALMEQSPLTPKGRYIHNIFDECFNFYQMLSQ